MKRGSTLFLKLIVLLIAIVVLTWMIVFPRLEGRATNLDLISIYTDPFIIYGYVASIPFFVGLFQALRLLGYVERDTIFSQTAIRAVGTINGLLTDPEGKGTDSSWSMWTPSSLHFTLWSTTFATPTRQHCQRRNQVRKRRFVQVR